MIRASSPPSAPPALACLARAGAPEVWAGNVRVREGGFSFSIWLSVSCAISAPLGYFLSSFCLLFILCLSARHCLYHYLLSLSLSRFSLFFVGLFLSVRFSCSIFQYLKPPEAQILQAGTIPKFTKVPTKYYFSFFNKPLHFSPPSVNR